VHRPKTQTSRKVLNKGLFAALSITMRMAGTRGFTYITIHECLGIRSPSPLEITKSFIAQFLSYPYPNRFLDTHFLLARP